MFSTATSELQLCWLPYQNKIENRVKGFRITTMSCHALGNSDCKQVDLGIRHTQVPKAM